jgi:hypothetical protein
MHHFLQCGHNTHGFSRQLHSNLHERVHILDYQNGTSKPYARLQVLAMQAAEMDLYPMRNSAVHCQHAGEIVQVQISRGGDSIAARNSQQEGT